MFMKVLLRSFGFRIDPSVMMHDNILTEAEKAMLKKIAAQRNAVADSLRATEAKIAASEVAPPEPDADATHTSLENTLECNMCGRSAPADKIVQHMNHCWARLQVQLDKARDLFAPFSTFLWLLPASKTHRRPRVEAN